MDTINNMFKIVEPFGIQPWYSDTRGIRIVDLLDENNCRSFLENYMHQIGAPTMKVAASLFVKQYARITVASTCYSITLHNRALLLPIQDCLLNDKRELCLKAETCCWQEWVTGDREYWQHSVWHQLFSKHLTPLLVSIKKATNLSNRILWENVVVRIHSIYRKMLAQELSSIARHQLINDFYFLKYADGDLFGCKESPIAAYLNFEATADATSTRRTCCLYYQLEKNEHCGVCPLTVVKGERD